MSKQAWLGFGGLASYTLEKQCFFMLPVFWEEIRRTENFFFFFFATTTHLVLDSLFCSGGAFVCFEETSRCFETLCGIEKIEEKLLLTEDTSSEIISNNWMPKKKHSVSLSVSSFILPPCLLQDFQKLT